MVLPLPLQDNLHVGYMECRSHQGMFWKNMGQDGPWVEARISSCGAGVQR